MIARLLSTKTTWVGLIWIAKAIVSGIFEGDWQPEDVLIGLSLIAGRDALAKLEKTKR